MTSFKTLLPPDGYDASEPSEPTIPRSMGKLELEPGQVTIASAYRTVKQSWLVMSGHGELWTRNAGTENLHALSEDVRVSIAPGVHFQFRSLGPETLFAVGITVAVWAPTDEILRVQGPWKHH